MSADDGIYIVIMKPVRLKVTQEQYDAVVALELKHAIACMRESRLTVDQVRMYRAEVDRLPEGLILDEKRLMLHVFSHGGFPDGDEALQTVGFIRRMIYETPPCHTPGTPLAWRC